MLKTNLEIGIEAASSAVDYTMPVLLCSKLTF
jgi:hypothetical protein